MLNRLKTYLKYGNHFCGIEHTVKGNENKIICTLLKKSKKELDIKATFKSKSIEELCSKLPKKQHAYLILNNDQILSKTIESNTSDVNTIVNKAFPNIDLNDFYFEILQQNKTHFVSICRRDYINSLIKEYKENGISIIDIGLGNLQISSIVDYIDSDFITSSNASISFENNEITSINPLNETNAVSYSINSLEVSNNDLLSFGGALQPILRNSATQHNADDLKFELKDSYKHSRFFSEFSKYSLVFFLGLLLVNFLFFNHYHSKVNELQEVAQINNTSKELIIKLNEDVTKKETMVNNMLKSGSSKSSFYTNVITQSMPNSILFSQIDYQPLAKRIKKDKPIEVNTNKLIISGSSNDSELFSNWITELEDFYWVKKIDINYSKGKHTISDFSLTIALEDE